MLESQRNQEVRNVFSCDTTIISLIISNNCEDKNANNDDDNDNVTKIGPY